MIISNFLLNCRYRTVTSRGTLLRSVQIAPPKYELIEVVALLDAFHAVWHTPVVESRGMELT